MNILRKYLKSIDIGAVRVIIAPVATKLTIL